MNGFRFGFALWLIVGWVLLIVAGPALANPPNSYYKPNLPDLDQHRPGSLPDNGDYHCSPTAAANSLKWFDQEMGLDVVPSGQTDTGLINELGTEMGTDKGTWNDDMVKGYRKYLRKHGGGRQWDVKFQGSKYFRGYTVGRNSPNVSLDWIKQELADGEDVTLTVDWWREGPAGTWTRLKGAHSITLGGYTSGTGTGNNSSSDLIISDPGYPELIIERDQDSVGTDWLIYNYSTGSTNLRAEVVGAVSVSPKPQVVVVDSYINPWEYTGPVQITGMNGLYSSTYSDYVHLGIDMGTVIQNIDTGQDLGTINIMSEMANSGLIVHFDDTGIVDILTSDGTVFDNSDLHVQFDYGFGESELVPEDHVRTELWIDRDVFGDFNVDSFFDITYEIDFDGVPGPMEMVGNIALNSQIAVPDGTAEGPVPDTDGDGNPDNNYPDPFSSTPDPLEIAEWEAAIASIPRIPGDANNDFMVNEIDAEIMAEHWGEGDATWAMGDFDDDHFVGPKDASIMAANWGFLGESESPVPEPGMFMWLAGALLGLLIRRWR